jgi:hypothetical protein
VTVARNLLQHSLGESFQITNSVNLPLPKHRGTSVTCLATEDGVFLAADDLVYAEREGQAIPLQRDFRKVGAINITLIGTAGLMIHHDIKYDVNDLIPELEKGLISRRNFSK